MILSQNKKGKVGWGYDSILTVLALRVNPQQIERQGERESEKEREKEGARKRKREDQTG